MKKVNYLIYLNFAACLFGLAVFVVCVILASCQKTETSTNEPIEYIENIKEAVETEELTEVDENDELGYETEAAKTKISVIGGIRDTAEHSGCYGINRYRDYLVGLSPFVINLTLSKADTIIHIINPTGYYNASINQISPTTANITITGGSKLFAARNIKWIATFANGKTTAFYTKILPCFFGKLYGTSEYHVNSVRVAIAPDKYSLGDAWSVQTPIGSSWTPQQFDILKFGQNHFGVIANNPIQKTTLIGGKRKNVWVFKVKEKNANCDQRATTKTIKWYPGSRVPSASPERDSASLFYRN